MPSRQSPASEACTLEITVYEARHIKPGTNAYVSLAVAAQNRRSAVAPAESSGHVQWSQTLTIQASSLEDLYHDKLQVNVNLAVT